MKRQKHTADGRVWHKSTRSNKWREEIDSLLEKEFIEMRVKMIKNLRIKWRHK